MKVKVLESFIDKYTGQVYKVNEELELEQSRVNEILSCSQSLIKVIKEKKAGLK